MRISTSSIYESGVKLMNQLQTSLNKTQNQISAQRRVLSPSDDPVAASRALEVSQSMSINSQFGINRQNANNVMQTQDDTLAGVTDVLQDARALILSAGNTTLTDSDRMALSAELRSQYDQLLGMANAQDGAGKYLFSGHQTSIPPFAKTSSGAVFQGDQGTRILQVDTSRQMTISESGDTIFNKIPSGNGTFLAKAPSTNNGTGTISLGTVVDRSALTSHNYEVNFTVAAGVTTYTITDTTTGNPVPESPAVPVPIPYTSGSTIEFDGIQFAISGAPTDGDKFTIEPSTNQNIFKVLSDAITLLETPATNGPLRAALVSGLASATGDIDKTVNNVLTSRASIGARLKELDSLDTLGEARDVAYQETLEDLVGLDLVKAYTDLTQQQVALEAAQKSYLKATGLSLFSYL